MHDKDYYGALGISENADANQIRDAYRRMAFKYHPDRNTDDDAAEKMKQVNEAYAVLSHPDKRRQYDAIRHQYGDAAHFRFRNAYTEQDIFRDSDIQRVFEEMARSFGLRGSDEMFKEFYGPGFRRFEFRRPGMYTRGFVFTGSMGKPRKTVDKDPLPNPFSKVARLLLKKAGLDGLPEAGRDLHESLILSPQQAQQGGPYAYYFKPKSKKLIVNIPPGVRSGQKIRLAGMGENGTAGGKPGDLYLRVAIHRSMLSRLKAFFEQLIKR